VGRLRYSLVFAEGNPFIAACATCFCAAWEPIPTPSTPHHPPPDVHDYQLMFAIITPALIAGAFAERVRFRAMAVFSTLWAFFVYFPMAHMVWVAAAS